MSCTVALTDSSCRHRIWFLLVGLQGTEDVGCGVEGARPDDSQARKVQSQQAQLADQAMLLHEK